MKVLKAICKKAICSHPAIAMISVLVLFIFSFMLLQVLPYSPYAHHLRVFSKHGVTVREFVIESEQFRTFEKGGNLFEEVKKCVPIANTCVWSPVNRHQSYLIAAASTGKPPFYHALQKNDGQIFFLIFIGLFVSAPLFSVFGCDFFCPDRES